MIRLGYACINMQLAEKGYTTNKGCIKRTWVEKGLPHVSSLALKNVQALKQIVEWNNEHNIQVYRMTSCLFPWMSGYQFEELPDFDEIFKVLNEVREIAQGGNQRLSFHPGPHNVLVSPTQRVVNNSIKDLTQHARIFDLMGYEADHNTKINIHLGGAYGNHSAAMERFCSVYKELPDSIRKRLTVENDDKLGMFSTKMLYEGVYKKVGCPIVFDSHHFELGPQDSSYEDALTMAAKTWGEVKPTCHHSNSKKNHEDEKVSRVAHSSWYYTPFKDLGLELDVVLECKQKERALLKYRKDFQ